MLTKKFAGVRYAVVLFVTVFLFLSTLIIINSNAASNAQPLRVFEGDICAAGLNVDTPQPKQVNMVLDDSGSMFMYGDGSVNKSWSAAKYSVEVFAAMLGPEDNMNVYLTSDFLRGATSGPVVQISGASNLSERVAKIHGMPMQGGGTPYAPVLRAVEDLSKNDAPEKWLVVLSDGEFEDRATPDVQSDLEGFVRDNTHENSSLQVAFLALGTDAPMLDNKTSAGVFFSYAPSPEPLLGLMTDFSNQIFGRSILNQDNTGSFKTDIDLDEIMIFAQGKGVEATALNSGGTLIEPEASVSVSWVDNQPAMFAGTTVESVPDKGLEGQLLFYEEIPAGNWDVGILNAKTIDVFYKPRVSFGVEIKNEYGEVVDADKLVGGDYTISFGFMDRDCAFIESALFGETNFRAQIIRDGETTDFHSGNTITLDRGEVTLEVTAEYLNGAKSHASADLTILRPPIPTIFDLNEPAYKASGFKDLKFPEDAIEVKYQYLDEGERVDFSAEEWQSFTPNYFAVQASDDRIKFDLTLGDGPGEIYLLPTAEGDIFDVPTGDISYSLAAAHTYDEQLIEGSVSSTLNIEDDISPHDRLLNWFKTTGWKLLALLLLLIWILGYLLRKRFPKQLQARPLTSVRPKAIGAKRAQLDAKFQKNRSTSLIPYKAETGVITPHHSTKIPKIKVRAAGQGRIEVRNWEAFKRKGNVTFNGEQITKDSKRAPSLRGGSVISVNNPDGIYEIQLNQSRASQRRRK